MIPRKPDGVVAAYRDPREPLGSDGVAVERGAAEVVQQTAVAGVGRVVRGFEKEALCAGDLRAVGAEQQQRIAEAPHPQDFAELRPRHQKSSDTHSRSTGPSGG